MSVIAIEVNLFQELSMFLGARCAILEFTYGLMTLRVHHRIQKKSSKRTVGGFISSSTTELQS